MFKKGDKVISTHIISVGPIETIQKYELLTIKNYNYYISFEEKYHTYKNKYFITIKEYRKQKLNKLNLK